MSVGRLIRAMVIAVLIGGGGLVVGALVRPAPAAAYTSHIESRCGGAFCQGGAFLIQVTVRGYGSLTKLAELIDSLDCTWPGGSQNWGGTVGDGVDSLSVSEWVYPGDSPSWSGTQITCELTIREQVLPPPDCGFSCEYPWKTTHETLYTMVYSDSTPPVGTVTVSPTQIVYGQNFTRIVDATDVPSGIYGFQCNDTVPEVGQAFIRCEILDYAGNSSIAAAGLLVSKASTTASITGRTVTSSVSGQSVTVNYGVGIVSPGGGLVAGNVTVSDGVDSCTATVAAGSCTLKITTVGTRTLTAKYAGSSRYLSSTSPGVSHTVTKGDVQVETYPDAGYDVVAGQAVTVYADVYNVLPAEGMMDGTVTIGDGIDSCSIAYPTKGSCILKLRTPGDRTVTATYSGDAHYKSGSASRTFTVRRAATQITPFGVDGGVVGEDLPYGISAVAVENASTFTVPGTADIQVTDGVDSCTATLADGFCYLRLTTPGDRSITIRLLQGPWWKASEFTGNTFVDPAATSTAITGRSPAPSAVGQPVAVSYAVSVVEPGHGTPGGNVTVTDGTDSCTGTVAAGSCQLTLTTAGSRTLTATYAGSSRFDGSTSLGVQHKVKIGTTTSQIGALTGPTAPGVPFNVAYTVTAADSSTPTGDVTVTWGSDTCTATVAAGSCSITPTAVGTKPVSITYSGDADRLSSSLAAGSKAVVYPFAWSGPKAPPLINSAKAGAKVPLRFTLGAGYGKAILAAGFPKLQTASCSTWAVAGTLASTSPKGSLGLTYTASTKVYSYGWQTSATWFKGKPVCRVVTVKLIDGTSWKLRYRFASAQ